MDSKFTGVTYGKDKGPTWRTWSWNFQLATSAAGLWKFYNGHYRVPLATSAPAVLVDFQHHSQVAYAVLNQNISPSVQEDIRQFEDCQEPAYESWKYLAKTY